MPVIDELRLGARLFTQQAVGNLVARRGDPLARLDHLPWKINPYPIYRELREAGPVTRSRFGIHLASTHAACQQVLRDRRFVVAGDPYRTQNEDSAPEVDLSFLVMNPPDHTRLRRLARPAFSPKLIGRYREGVERVSHRLVEEMLARGTHREIDLMAEFAAPLPIAVISDLLGIPDADSDRFVEYGRVVGQSLDGLRSLSQVHRTRGTSADLRELFTDLMERRRKEPGDDAISLLVRNVEAGELTPDELIGVCGLLLVAGFETTVNLIGNATVALQRNPEQWKALVADPDLAPAAVEETLRYDAPVQMTSRAAGEDLEVAGVPLRAGQLILVLLGSAGRDPEAHDRPDVFDIGREQRSEHLAFSGGIHYCLGAPLARMEGDVALRVLADRLPDLRIARRPRRRRTTTIRGFAELPVLVG